MNPFCSTNWIFYWKLYYFNLALVINHSLSLQNCEKKCIYNEMQWKGIASSVQYPPLFMSRTITTISVKCRSVLYHIVCLLPRLNWSNKYLILPLCWCAKKIVFAIARCPHGQKADTPRKNWNHISCIGAVSFRRIGFARRINISSTHTYDLSMFYANHNWIPQFVQIGERPNLIWP